MRNSLWPATRIPTKMGGNHLHKNMDSKENNFCNSSSPFLCHALRKSLSAYVLFNDEDDGYRITWIAVDGGFDDDDEPIPHANSSSFENSPNSVRPTRKDIVVPSDDDSLGSNWEECFSDPVTGHRTNDDALHLSSHRSSLNIAFEVYLRIDALLSDILSRRQSSLFQQSPYYNNTFFMPEFFYNLISACPDSLKVKVVIVFSNKEKMMMHSSSAKMAVPSALGIFAEVNLFDQTYDELKWVQHPSCKYAFSMKQWCHSLALNWRMKECRVGVFCVDGCRPGPKMDQWVGQTHECNVDEDLLDDVNADLWNGYVERLNNEHSKRKGMVAAPKDVSMSSLYPYCDVITNRAVHSAIPVKRIASRNSPIELVYG